MLSSGELERLCVTQVSEWMSALAECKESLMTGATDLFIVVRTISKADMDTDYINYI